MAGYCGFSKSNNAVEAESDGRYPASVLARRLGVHPGAIRALLHSNEWHHSSKYFNIVDYYSEEEALEIIDQLKAWRQPAQEAETLQNCSGSYLVWGGTRNHPRAKVIKFDGVTVSKKGDWYTLHMPAGPVRKNKDTRGFNLTHDGKTLEKN